MKFFVVHGQLDKCQAYIDALTQRGHMRVQDVRAADFVLYDFVRRSHEYLFQRILQRGIPTFIFPHAALSMYMWDGLVGSYPVACNFTFGEGPRQVMDAYGYAYPTASVGWSYSPRQAFQPTAPATKILFAPKHPNGGLTGLIEEDQERNREAFRRLRRTGLELTVYYGKQLEANGLRRVSGVHYLRSKLSIEGALEQIRNADVVVAHDTFAYLAIAAGKPTVMFVGDQVPHALGRRVEHWDRYRQIAKYPLDLLDTEDAQALIERAASTDEDIRDWRARMIGDAFNAEALVDRIERCFGRCQNTGSLILNEMAGIHTKRYLELGIADNANFDRILCRHKMSVDINGKALFTGTTDAFFQSLDRQQIWNLIFIDANHDFPQVLRDFNQAIQRCTEWILIHDMIPPTAKHTASRFCSDSYKLLYYLMMQPKIQVYPMCENYGLTFVRMPVRPVSPPRSICDLSYESFMSFLAGERLYTREEIVRLLNGC